MRCSNIVVQDAHEFGFTLVSEGGTDNWFTDCTVNGAGLSGFDAAGWGDRYIGCKAFGCGARDVSGNGAGFLIRGSNQLFTCCSADENASRGYHLLGSDAGRCNLSGCTAISNGDTGLLLDACMKNTLLGFVSAHVAGFAQNQNWSLRIINGAASNHVDLVAQGNLSGAVQETAEIGNNQIFIDNGRKARLYDAWGAVGSDNEHFTFGKEEAGVAGNPYFTLKTDPSATPRAQLQSWDGTNARSYFKADHATNRFIIGDQLGGLNTVIDLLTSEPPHTILDERQVVMWLDASASVLKVKVEFPGGTVRSGSVQLA